MDVLTLAKKYKKERKFNLAIEELKRASSTLAVESDALHLELAWLYHDINDNDSAIKELQKVIRLGRDNNEVRLGLARLYQEEGQYNLAIEQLKTAIKNHPTDGRIYHRLGWIYREKGECALSVKYFNQAAKIWPYKDSLFFRNKIYNEQEISQKKVVLNSKPMVLGVTLTHRCNIECTMCELSKSPWDIPQKAVREISEFFPYLQRVYWQGGEPFLSPYFYELFTKAAAYPNLSQTIVTNGLLINTKWARELVKSRVEIIFSIDGATKHTYEKIRDGAKFENLLSSIDIFNEYRNNHDVGQNSQTQITTIMQAVIMRSNYQELEKFVDFALKHKFSDLNLIPLRYFSREEDIFLNQDSQALGHIESVMPQLLRKAQERGLKLSNQLPCSQATKDSDRAQTARQFLCYWPWKSLYILLDGKVKPYGFCEEQVGNINQHSLREIWNSQKMQLYRQKLLDNDNSGWCSLRCTSGVMPKDCLILD